MPKVVKYRLEDLPPPGSVFLVPLADGRFGVVRVLRTKSTSGYAFAYVVASSWIGASAVRPADEEIRQPLIVTHHDHHRWAKQPEAIWVVTPPPAVFIPAGVIEITAADRLIAKESYSHWENLAFQILAQWRWDHDREAVLIEDAARNLRQAQEERLAEARRAEMLRTLTLESVTSRIWFEGWDEELDGPNQTAARQLIGELIDRLRKAPKLTKAVARRMLRATVSDFNRLDAKTQFIETTHREDIHEALELVMAAARHPELADEVDRWRDW